MATNILEQQAYQIPIEVSLKPIPKSGSFDLWDKIQPGSYDHVAQLARERDFRQLDTFRSKRGLWYVFERLDHEIPNFPEGYAITHSMLGVYEGDSSKTHAVLRLSSEPFPAEQFVQGLNAISRHYIERPFVFGFPSRLMTDSLTPAAVAIVGVVAGGLSGDAYNDVANVAYYNTGKALLAGIFSGLVLPVVGHMLLYPLSEWRARRKISSLEEYFVGNAVSNVLYQEQAHIKEVTVQRELYTALQQQGYDLTPEQFLTQVYQEIPRRLINERIQEIETQHPLEQRVETSFNRIFGITRFLLENSQHA